MVEIQNFSVLIFSIKNCQIQLMTQVNCSLIIVSKEHFNIFKIALDIKNTKLINNQGK